MNLSLGEFRALVAKAFRGAGYSWGLTEDASFAAMRLAEHGIDAGLVVTRLLEATEGRATTDLMPDATWQCRGEFLCPICVGASIADGGGCADLSLDRMAEPTLLAPFLMAVTQPGGGYVIEWDTGQCEVSNVGIVLSGSPHGGAGPTTITPQAVAAVDTKHHTRVDLDEATKQAIEGFAHKTYAPATEASRLAGAGAGLTDDD